MNIVSKTMIVSFLTNTFLSLFKIFAGWIGKSGALIADGLHSFSDLSTDIVAIIGNKLSRKPADEKHPYGHGKIEYITSIFIAFVILILGITVIINAVTKEIQIPSLFVACISLVTIFVKYILSSYIIKIGEREKNSILLASGYESKTDVFSSIVVFLSILFMQFSKTYEFLKYADVVAMLLVGLLILKIGFEVLKENVSSILEEQVTDDVYLNKLKQIILETKEIRHIDEIKVIKFGNYYKVDAEVSMDPFMSLLKSHRHIHEAENLLRAWDNKILYIQIHVNPEETYTLQKATQKDLPWIEKYRLETALQGSLSQEEIEKRKNFVKKETKKHISDYQMIMQENERIGVVAFYMQEESLYIEEIFIEERFRYCGIGSSILKQIIEEHQNIPITLWVSLDNLFAISLYKKLGFREEKREETRMKMRLDNKKKKM